MRVITAISPKRETAFQMSVRVALQMTHNVLVSDF